MDSEKQEARFKTMRVDKRLILRLLTDEELEQVFPELVDGVSPLARMLQEQPQ